MKHIDLDHLRSVLDYNPDTGVFTWRTSHHARARCGEVAGNVSVQGYLRIGVQGQVVLAARLAWFYIYGEWPKRQVVHVDGNRLNNRLVNLQLRVHSSKLPPLTADRLRELVIYDPATGLFSRRTNARGPKPKTMDVGWLRPNGYAMLTVDGTPYRAHRLAWLYVHGRWPTKHIDHINGDPADNRIENLRDATVAQNMANSKKPRTNTSGYKGVQWHKAAGKWVASIKVGDKNVYLGLFDTAEEARDAYRKKALEVRGEFARFD